MCIYIYFVKQNYAIIYSISQSLSLFLCALCSLLRSRRYIIILQYLSWVFFSFSCYVLIFLRLYFNVVVAVVFVLIVRFYFLRTYILIHKYIYIYIYIQVYIRVAKCVCMCVCALVSISIPITTFKRETNSNSCIMISYA